MLEAGDVQSAQMGENEDQVELIIATAFWCFARPRYRLLARPGHVLVQYALGTHRRSHCNAQDLRPLLNRVVTRERFNDSFIYNIYLSVFRRQAAEQRRHEFGFYNNILRRNRPLIFDIGASVGHKAKILRKLAKQVLCVEPTPTAVEELRRRFLYEPRA